MKPRCCQKRRRGFSLLELILALAIAAIAAAMIIPTLFGVQGRQRLRNGAEQMSGVISGARQQAMVTGQTMFLLYQPNTPLYAVVPEPVDQTTKTQFDLVTQRLDQAGQQTSYGNENGFVIDGITGMDWLPSGLKFVFNAQNGISAQEDVASLPAEFSGLPYIAFSPDGTTDDALLELVNEELDQVAIQVRGLTGAVSLGEIIGYDPLRVTQ